MGHEYGVSRAPRAMPVRSIPSRHRAKGARRSARVGLRADADCQVIRTRKRPDVAGWIGHHFNDDLLARDAVGEEAGRDRDLRAAEGACEASSREAVGAVGADEKSRAVGGAGLCLDSPARGLASDAGHARRDELGTGAARGVKELRIELGAARDNQAAMAVGRGERHAQRRWRRRPSRKLAR